MWHWGARAVVGGLTAVVLLASAAAAHAEPGGPGRQITEDERAEAAAGDPYPEATVDYPAADWVSASATNYTRANRPKSHPIRYVVIHVMQGSYEGTKAWFRNPDSDVTTHYIMRASDGKVTQMVREKDIAWHAGNWDYNTKSIGIEHEGFVADAKWFDDTVYQSSAALVRSICERYDIPMDRRHIIGHVEVPGADHTDPGEHWDWDRYMDLVRGDDETTTITLDNDDDGVTAGDAWRTGTSGDQYGDDHRYATPVLRSDPLWYHATIPERGRYRVQVWYPADRDNNNRTPYIVNTSDGDEPVFVDQRTGGGAWRTIGSFRLDAGEQPVVAVSRWTGGTGTVVADGIRLIRQ